MAIVRTVKLLTQAQASTNFVGAVFEVSVSKILPVGQQQDEQEVTASAFCTIPYASENPEPETTLSNTALQLITVIDNTAALIP